MVGLGSSNLNIAVLYVIVTRVKHVYIIRMYVLF